MLIKISIRYNYSLLEWLELESVDDQQLVNREYGATRTLTPLAGVVELVLKIAEHYPVKLKMSIFHDSAFPCLSM